MFDKQIEKLIDRTLYGSKKDRRIKELWDELNHAYSVIRTYGQFEHYQANPKWEPPEYFRDGEYTMEKRLADIRWNSEKITECSDSIFKTLFSIKD